MESRKIVQMNLFPGQEKKRRHREQTCGHGEGREGEGGMNWEIRFNINTLQCIK